jgi:prepilin-type N-terminal cleavage/methylation domain-containing protein
MEDTRTDNSMARRRSCRRLGGAGFTLLEVLTALAILAFVSSSVLVVIDRCIVSASDSAMRMEAFQLARENMEKVLARESVEETVEYGRSDTYPDITWQTVIEAFAEPLTGMMWVRALCSAEYTDSAGERQTIELEHWLTELSDQQADQLAGEPKSIEELTAEQLLASAEEAAEYAGVNVETIDAWMEGGLLTTGDGAFIKYNLDVFVRSDGRPTDLEKEQQVRSIEELAQSLQEQQQGDEQAPGGLQRSDGRDPLTGLPQEQLDQMNVGDVMRMLNDRKQQR